MKNIYKLFLMCGALVAISACTDLEETLVGEVDAPFNGEEPTFGTFDGGGSGPSDAVSSAYNQLRESGSANHGGYWSVQSVSTDEMAVTQKGGDWYDGGIWIDMHRHTYGPGNGPVNDTWGAQYSAIGACNTALAAGTLDDNQTAQVRALRAFFYLRLLDLYGRVKIVTTPGEDAPQATRAAVFNFVESELLGALGVAAITPTMDLSASPLTTAPDPYRINQYAALGLLAKLYLNAEVYAGTPRYTEAATAAGYVIDNGGYVLCDDGCATPNVAQRPSVASDPDELEGYAAVFAPNNQNNPEIIWSIAYDNVTGTNMNFAQMTLHYSSQFTWNLQNQPWNGYSALEDFYNSYDDTDERKSANFIVGAQSDYEGSVILDYAATGDDLELNYSTDINELEPNASRKGGARLGKFSFRQGQRDNMDNDFPIVRLGDLYLIRAEGIARAAGAWSLALPDVNTIRARAGLTDALGSLTAEEFLAERGREMFMEVTRRSDLIRFGKYNDAWWEKPTSAASKNVFPIPQEQIDASNGTLTQNPGY
ncbi:RagB/SusD family nutrient uptake outer membrane protein [Cellulophaga sp. HaHa_2_95]|uniref:RagB/SusD family nutrient uptake outer membrane protein n=1 Tax=unclassified Cellulophaga TaxID=2634405 RepID=UPI001C4E96F3|nr:MULTISPECIES: RagB/SusD family nutrient uptake outer membrane protein [unclassified Cellulophaga]QXP50640.1 RagB/SusD family nutrient uptake outer membrane protein [Cellulophaga sp. HaHa_2_1]QXP57037.1 RagB/SusD family nutrient uptake outer membrane protein [Cellulophaga sp. HaHa_2_95]